MRVTGCMPRRLSAEARAVSERRREAARFEQCKPKEVYFKKAGIFFTFGGSLVTRGGLIIDVIVFGQAVEDDSNIYSHDFDIHYKKHDLTPDVGGYVERATDIMLESNY